MKIVAILTTLLVTTIASQAVAEYPTKKIAGTYRYTEKGHKGTMTIEVAKYAEVKIDTSNRDGGCDLEGVLHGEDKNGIPTQGVDIDSNGKPGSTSFKIKFSGKKAIITLNQGGGGNSCGMPPRGTFEGKWIKIE